MAFVETVTERRQRAQPPRSSPPIANGSTAHSTTRENSRQAESDFELISPASVVSNTQASKVERAKLGVEVDV